MHLLLLAAIAVFSLSKILRRILFWGSTACMGWALVQVYAYGDAASRDAVVAFFIIGCYGYGFWILTLIGRFVIYILQHDAGT